MKRREKIVGTIVCVLILLFFSKCAYLMAKPYFTDLSKLNSTKSYSVSKARGNIYDCNGDKLVNDVEKVIGVIKPTTESMRILKESLSMEKYIDIQFDLLKGEPTFSQLDESVLCSKDIIEIKTCERYSEGNMLRHVLGYIDADGKGVCGIEKSFDEMLNDNCREIFARFTVDANSRVLMGEEVLIDYNNYYDKSGISLTIDKRIQKICEETMDEFKVEKGAVVVLDVKNSKILASASRPTYEPYKVEASLDNENSPMINRSFSAFSTGSVFKIIVAASALKSGIDIEYTCSGNIEAGGVIFNCHKEEGHGVVGLEDAISQSCNTYFINLSQLVGADAILETAEALGFGKSVELCDGVETDNGYLPSVNEIDSLASLANLSFGQGSLMTSPLQIAVMTASVANSGYHTSPSLVNGMVDKDEKLKQKTPEAPTKVLGDEVCEFIKKAMYKTIIAGTGGDAKPINTTAGVKTSTAEKSNGGTNAWLTGFFPYDNPKYAVAILKEDGKSGGKDCGPIFKNIAEKITLLF